VPFSFKLGDNITGSYESSANQFNWAHNARISYKLKALINDDIQVGKC
jgi:hypothetical protein